jgi:hypothetical protein
MFAGAHGLALGVSVIAMALFAAFGWPLAVQAAHGSSELATWATASCALRSTRRRCCFCYRFIPTRCAPRGGSAFMAIAGLLVTLANIGFNYLLIVGFELGVAGSAWGTAWRRRSRLGWSFSIARAAGRG